MNATAFYTYGYGYYKQYKDDAWLAGYTNLQSDIEQADLIREKIMRNHLGGINASAAYSVRNLDLTFGGSWSYYSCPHWGTLDWVDGLKKSDIRGRWYDNDVDKQDANVFVRANWTVARGLRLFADMQYRYVHYQAWGVNDNYNWDTSAMQPIDVDKKYHSSTARGHPLHARRPPQLLRIVRRRTEGAYAQRLHRPLYVLRRQLLSFVRETLRL